MDNLINKLFPAKCIFCNKVGDIFCENCISDCDLLKKQYCIVCDRLSYQGFTHKKCLKKHTPLRLYCVFEYKDKVRECIRRSKYYYKEFMALKRLSFEGANLAYEDGFYPKTHIIIPIPASPERMKKRGFNQVEIICRYLNGRFDLPVYKDVLFRVKHTKAQHKIGRKERFENIRGSFAVKNSEKIKGKKILLVDDICTTGATFLESSKVLYESGAFEVRCFALSKKVKA